MKLTDRTKNIMGKGENADMSLIFFFHTVLNTVNFKGVGGRDLSAGIRLYSTETYVVGTR